jgi:Na+:H+ antiporter, NhaA family
MEDFSTPVVTEHDHVRGPADAPVTLLEYGDYECPFCRGAFRDVHEMLDRYPDKIRFAFRNFPIQQVHPHAEQAAEAAEAAAAQGKFWPMYGLLLQPYARLDADALVDYAERIGLDVPRFRADIADQRYARKIAHDVQEGLRNGVNQTPKFYVNGRRVDGKVPLENLEAQIRAAVAAADSGARG